MCLRFTTEFELSSPIISNDNKNRPFDAAGTKISANREFEISGIMRVKGY